MGDNALLRSPVVASHVPSCMEFKYHMYGRDISQLRIVAIDSVTGQDSIMWSKLGRQQNAWIPAMVDLPANPGMQVSTCFKSF